MSSTKSPQTPLDNIRPAASPAAQAASPQPSANPEPPQAKSGPAKPSTSSGGRVSLPWYRRRWVYVAVAGVLVTALAGTVVAMKLMAKPAKPVAVKPSTPSPTPTPPPPIYSPLTGLPVANSGAAQSPVVGVMIENLYPDARPQSGLSSAGIVYEALAEGGITRFLGIFQEPLPPSLGPVRSLRPYYLDWGLEYGIPVAHAGGSQPALAEVGPLGLKDINALVYSGSYFFRTTDRAAPHNLYTNNSLLAQLVTKLGFGTPPAFTPFPRKPDAPPASATHPVIKINFSSAAYSVQYNYTAGSNSYARIMGGVPHVDRNTGQQIMVKNIVLEFVPTTYGTQPDSKPETDYHLTGSGQAVVFTDGGATPATWSKTSDAAPTALTDSSGKPISFNRGNTWYEIVPTGTSVTY